jgi:predicted cupin superfamily sugar epimerase
MIDKDGNYSFQKVGLNIKNNELPQFVVPKNVWFASEVNDTNSYSFVGCTVSPGFDFDDFELADRKDLITQFPPHKKIIKALTR